ncbi:hypothetical protein MUN88_00870 [Gracilibacillus caseinilyticus]|uniref:PH domain-containing protein n=1 Tax=Gracilibacillus caseinilyticus TaxID=2932256 RepID=A0ABY4F2T7_9BACI|nr:hypothetical protein [Gracilibacillus caseinilyticus]UOQ48746.1 hypothetical protein MUN88_00870 [Gracilibacillus caseinilyticus]
MEYHINPIRSSNISIFCVAICWTVLSDYYGFSYSLFFLYLIGAAGIASSIRFKFEIQEDHLVYQVFLFKKSFIKREIYPDQVKQLEFIRAGWAKKAAILYVHTGRNIRLAVLEPSEAYEHLMEFAEGHDISIAKTDEYLILEKKQKYKSS